MPLYASAVPESNQFTSKPSNLALNLYHVYSDVCLEASTLGHDTRIT